METYTEGAVKVQLNHRKGVWCEFCNEELLTQHKIRLESNLYQKLIGFNLCLKCAQDLVKCLKYCLTEALITGDQ